MSVGLESNFFQIETFSNFNLWVYKIFFWETVETQEIIFKHFKGGLLESSLRCPEILIGFCQEKNYFGGSSLL